MKKSFFVIIPIFAFLAFTPFQCQKTSDGGLYISGDMGESWEQDPRAVGGNAAAQANAGGCNCARQAVAVWPPGHSLRQMTPSTEWGVFELTSPGCRGIRTLRFRAVLRRSCCNELCYSSIRSPR